MEDKHKAMITHFIFSLVICLSFVLIKTRASGPINLTLVGSSAVSKGAFCLDGSLPAYNFDEGFGDGVSNWLVYLEGGAWCSTKHDCNNRKYSYLGSSSHMKEAYFSGILDSTKTNNPDFYNWNRVYVRYCDGSSFMGDVKEIDPVTNLHYRGARIFDAVMEELLAKGMKDASNVILTGCSAGSLATILHCDGFRTLFPGTTRVKCISDGGFFIRAKDLSGAKEREDYFGGVVALHEIAKRLPSSCTSRMDPGLCFFPENLVGNIQTPLFLLNSAFDSWQIGSNLEPPLVDQPGWNNCTKMNLNLCTTSQLQLIKDFKTFFLQALRETGKSSTRGMLIHSCYLHCHTYGGTWENFRTLENKTLAKVIGDWYFDRASYQEIDTKNLTPQNCSLRKLNPLPYQKVSILYHI